MITIDSAYSIEPTKICKMVDRNNVTEPTLGITSK